MMRLQRGLLRSGVSFAVRGTAGAASVLGLILALVFAVAAAGMVAGCVKSDGAAPSATRAAPTDVVTSGLGGIAGEVCEATGASFADVVGATACFDALGANTDSVVTFGIGGPLGSISFVITNTDAMPSAITAMTGRNDLRMTSIARLD